jgi:hypothetical protein
MTFVKLVGGLHGRGVARKCQEELRRHAVLRHRFVLQRLGISGLSNA